MIDRVFSFADKEAQQVMVPRTQVVGIEMQTRIADVAPQVATSTYTRFPVYEENLDTIHGMVHVKDIIAAVGSGRGEEQVRAIMRPGAGRAGGGAYRRPDAGDAPPATRTWRSSSTITAARRAS